MSIYIYAASSNTALDKFGEQTADSIPDLSDSWGYMLCPLDMWCGLWESMAIIILQECLCVYHGVSESERPDSISLFPWRVEQRIPIMWHTHNFVHFLSTFLPSKYP